MWWNYGIWAGDPVDQRRPEPLNNIMPKHINWVLNSLDDGTICMGAILLIYIGKHPKNIQAKCCTISVRKDGLAKFHLSGLAIPLVWFLVQNILVEMVVYSAQVAKDKELSWAPLAPLGPWVNPTIFTIGDATCTLQGQMPWLLMTPIFYFVLLWQHSWSCNDHFA